jgi:hypothetical protein
MTAYADLDPVSTAYADLEIGLHPWDAESYAVELRYSPPRSDADIRLVPKGPAFVRFDLDRLRLLTPDTAEYGQLLSRTLFADPAVLTAFKETCVNAQSHNVPLRVRLLISSSAPKLHALRWETLRDPREEYASLLLTGDHVLFSRYLDSLDWRPVHARPQNALRALVVIANPADLGNQPGRWPFKPIDVEGELSRAEAGLAKIAVTTLGSGGSAHLENIIAHLRDGHDILYLVCHGALVRGEPRLWLEDEAGDADVVAGSELVDRLRELPQTPGLVVLASCQSAGMGEEARSDDGGVLAALGPRLADAGVPAVLAMQGNITMRTVAEFMPVFFKELQRDGQIDRAVAVARGAIRERPDNWTPVLFMRLRSGRIWGEPGPGDRPVFEKWDALLMHIHRQRCTPILGSGLVESLLGSSREIARRWADTYRFPMSPHDREDLPQVAQYLTINQDQSYPREELPEYLRRELLRRYQERLPQGIESVPLDELIAAVGKLRREEEALEPHQILARLPFPIYITTNPDPLLEDALADASSGISDGAVKRPQMGLCNWNERIDPLPSVYDREPDYRPDATRPLVYHLFGRLSQPDSLVLTEDDYFDYLISVTSDKERIPGVVRRALANTALLFLGFQLDDWNFRVLFRSILSQGGSTLLKRYVHVAVQIDPQGGHILEPERARRYLEGYFGHAEISIYWGSVEEFVKELQSHWILRYGPDPGRLASPYD